ncbi:MAG: PIN domain nuclease [Actinobacteria bacterium]|nr:PIN domain nuclease [Actinomycetota bacterium]MCL5986379.1 PIN domain nuclease [Actinomycetota bacterium]
MVIVDTSVWIDFLKGIENKKTQKLSSLEDQKIDIYTTGLIISEILSGIKSNVIFKELESKLLNLQIVNPIYPSTYINAATIYRDGRKQGITIRKMIDCLIAQLAIENSLFLLHKDEDFDKIATFTNLKIY